MWQDISRAVIYEDLPRQHEHILVNVGQVYVLSIILRCAKCAVSQWVNTTFDLVPLLCVIVSYMYTAVVLVNLANTYVLQYR